MIAALLQLLFAAFGGSQTEEEPVVPNYDAYRKNVVLGLTMEGSNNSTAFRDYATGKAITVNGNAKIVAGVGKSVTANGNAAISTVEKRFGTSSSYYDGTGDYLSITSSDLDIRNVSSLTVCAWVYVTSLSAARGIFFSGSLASDDNRMQLGINTDGSVTFYKQDGVSGSATAASSAGTIVINRWYHLEASISGGTMRLFVDGTLVGSSVEAVTLTASSNFYIGTHRAGATQRYMQGYIDGFKVYNGVALHTTTFTPSAAPYVLAEDTYAGKCALALDFGGENGSTIFNDSSRYGVYKFGAKPSCAYFDGTGDYLTVADSTDFEFGSGDFTISLWVRYAAKTTADTILGKGFNGGVGPWVIWSDLENIYFFASSNNSTWNLISALVIKPSHQTGVWYHLAVTRSGNTWRTFCDGVLSNETTVAGTIYDSSTALHIGASVAGTADANIYVDDIRILKNIAAYITNFTPPTTPSDYGDLYHDQVVYEANFDDPVPNISDYYRKYLVLGLPFDGRHNSTIFEDKTGKTVTANGNAKILNGLPITVAGNTQLSSSQKKFGTTSAYFDGSGDYLTVPDSGSLTFSGNFTIEAWVYPTGAPASGPYTIISKRNASTSDNTFSLRLGNGIIDFEYTTDGVTPQSVTVAFVWQQNTWTHIAVVRNGNLIFVFGDGVLLNGGGTAISGTLWDSSTAMAIGAQSQLSYNTFFLGFIDDLIVTNGTGRYTGTFTPATTAYDITTDLYAKNVVFYSDFNGAHGSTTFVEKSLTTYRFPEKPSGGFFDGGSDYLTVADHTDFEFGSGDFTVEVWVKYLSLTAADTIVGKGFNGTIGSWVIWGDGSNIYFFASSNNSSWDLISALIIKANHQTGVWYHLAVTRSGNVWRTFCDGIKVSETTVAGTIYDGTGVIHIGASGAGNADVHAYIDDLRMYKGVALYTTNFTPPVAPHDYGDPHRQSVSLLLRMNGDNNSRIFTDETGKTVNSTGNVVCSTTYSKFNGSSAYFDGTGDHLSVPGSADFTLPGNFTIEGWVYPLVNYTDSYSVILTLGTYTDGLSIRNYEPNGAQYTVFVNNTTITGASNPWAPANTWTHFALVRSGSAVTFYVNGAASGTLTNAGTCNSTASTVWIGAEAGGGAQFNGYMQDIRITKGIARYTTTFAVPQRQVSFYDPYLYDTVLHLPLTGPSGSTKITTVSPHPAMLKITANGNAAVSTTQSKFNGSSVYFDGTGDYIEVANDPVFNFGTSNFTIEFWVYLPTPANYQQLIVYANGNASNSNYAFVVACNSGTVRGSVYSGVTAYTADAGSISANTWTHIVFMRSGDTLYAFANGTIGVGSAFSGSPNNPASSVLRIGSGYNDSYTTGYIQDVRISTVARYSASFFPVLAYPYRSYADNTTTAILTGQINNTTNATLTNVSKFGSYSMAAIDSGFRSITSGKDTISGDFSFECWVYFTSFTGTASILTFGDEATGRVNFFVNTSGELKHNLYGGADSGIYYTFSANQWYFVTLCRSSSTVYMFVNGTAGTSQTLSGTIGNNGAWVHALYGYIDDIKLTNGVAKYTSSCVVPQRTQSQNDPYLGDVSLLMHLTDNFNDSSINSHAVSMYGNVSLSSSQYRWTPKSCYFDGNGDYLSIPSSSTMDFSTGDFTVEFWMYYVNGALDYPTILSSNAAAWGAGAQSIVVDSLGSVNKLTLYRYGLTPDDVISTGTITPNTWTHVALSRSGSSLRWFINGTLDSTTSVSDSVQFSSNGTVIGGGNWDGAQSYFSGYLQDLRVTKGVARYTTTFIPPQRKFQDPVFEAPAATNYAPYMVLGLHMDGTNNSTTITDVMGKTVTPVGNARLVTSTKRFGTASCYFDGTGDYLTLDDSTDFKFGTGDFSVSLWFKRSGRLGAVNYLIAKSNGVTEASADWYCFLNASDQPAFTIYSGTTPYAIVSSIAVTDLTTWHHLAICRQSGVARMFLDGVFVGSVAANVSPNDNSRPLTVGSTQYWNGGAWGYSTDVLHGLIDDLQVHKGASIYTANFTPPTSAFS